MEMLRLKRRDGVAVDQALIKAFQNDFHGQVVQPGDASQLRYGAPDLEREHRQASWFDLSWTRMINSTRRGGKRTRIWAAGS
jgi:hypothetical protein